MFSYTFIPKGDGKVIFPWEHGSYSPKCLMILPFLLLFKLFLNFKNNPRNIKM